MTRAAVFFVLLATLLIFVHSQSHNVTWGTRGPNDVEVHRAVIFKKSRLFLKVEGDYEFNLKATPFVRAITQIVITDQYTNGKGGYATLTSGGPLSTEVKIHFTSQRSHGFNFIVNIYGR